MTVRIVCRKNEFHDSMVLMRINESIRQMEGIIRVAILMATNNNKKILSDYRFWTDAIRSATAADLILAVEGIDEEGVDKAFHRIDEMFAERATSRRGKRIFKTQNAALRSLPGANLALISVPGSFAAIEARKALNNGLNIFLFSDNVPLEDELSLKRIALEKDLLVMGPDCGTAMISGVGLGFVNRVRCGEIGIVGASGTGIQEVSTQIHRLGMGISHAIGTGGRDLSQEIGGISMLQGIELLLKDPSTRIIVLISKPPSSQVQGIILDRIRKAGKLFVINFIGIPSKKEVLENCHSVSTLEEAAETAVILLKGKNGLKKDRSEDFQNGIQKEISSLNPNQKYLRGIFAGGTLAYEAMSILCNYIDPIYSNIPLHSEWRLENVRKSIGHTIIDMGEDEFTQGRPHPMIDPSLFIQRIKEEASDPEVVCILLDCILGLGVHPDPASVFSPIIKECKEEAKKLGRHLNVILSICGTDEDPQIRSLQEKKFREAGAIVQPNNAQAARFAGLLCKDRG